MKVLENAFSWSRSRAGAFDRCLRAYWWQYYGAWGGWDRNAPPEAREAYVLKNLANRWSWAGSAVHARIERILKRLQERALADRLPFAAIPLDPAAEVEGMTRSMRAQYRESLAGRYRDNPKKSFGLMEHEYRDPVDDAQWREVNAKAKTALRGFLESEVFAHIRETDPAGWFPIERLDQFDFEGTGIWTVPDFARRDGTGGAEIYDWKTGAVKPDEDRIQLAGYTLWMESRHGIDPERVKNRLVYLGPEVIVHDFVLGPVELEQARGEIRASVAAMRARLADPATNRADREDFPLTDDRSRCSTCGFRRLCGR